MTKKHFKAIAEAIRDVTTQERGSARKAVRRVAWGLAKVCMRDNGRFNYDKFMSACGIEG